MDAALLAKVCEHANGTGFNAVLGSLYVKDGRAQAGNGRYTLEVPAAELPDMCTPADRLHAAMRACSGSPEFKLTDVSVMVRSGAMKVRLPLIDAASYPVTQPDPPVHSLAEDLGALLKRQLPFIAADASRPWATSVCLAAGKAYATNNVVICRQPFPFPFNHPVNLPLATVEAIIDNPNPVSLGVSERSLTFYYADGSWIKTQLVEGEFPVHVIDGMLDGLPTQLATPAKGKGKKQAPQAATIAAPWVAVDDKLKKMLDTAGKLATDRYPVVELAGDRVTLQDGNFECEGMTGLPDVPAKVNAKMAGLVFAVADRVAWHTPKDNAHGFSAGELRGVFGGVR